MATGLWLGDTRGSEHRRPPENADSFWAPDPQPNQRFYRRLHRRPDPSVTPGSSVYPGSPLPGSSVREYAAPDVTKKGGGGNSPDAPGRRTGTGQEVRGSAPDGRTFSGPGYFRAPPLRIPAVERRHPRRRARPALCGTSIFRPGPPERRSCHQRSLHQRARRRETGPTSDRRLPGAIGAAPKA